MYKFFNLWKFDWCKSNLYFITIRLCHSKANAISIQIQYIFVFSDRNLDFWFFEVSGNRGIWFFVQQRLKAIRSLLDIIHTHTLTYTHTHTSVVAAHFCNVFMCICNVALRSSEGAKQLFSVYWISPLKIFIQKVHSLNHSESPLTEVKHGPMSFQLSN